MSEPVDTLDQLENQLRQAVSAGDTEAGVSDAARAGKQRKPKGRKKPGTSRGIETLFRTSYDVQLGLTSLADTKANMMISINGIIISVIIAAIAPRLEDHPLLLLPTGIFLLGSTVAIVFAILAAQPRLWRATDGDPADGDMTGGNPLFFANFAQHSEDKFVERMLDLMDDRGQVYEAMLRNIHGLGSVLRRKFHLLSIAYRSFMLALIFGVTSAVAVFFAL